MLRIRDDIYVGLVIGNQQYPLESTGFQSLKIVSSLDTFVPMLEIQLVDNLNFFSSSITLADGLQLQVQLGTTERDWETMFFRVHKFRQNKENSSNLYAITAYLDVPLFYLATANKPFAGTSYAAIQAIAGRSGLSFKGDATSDSQVWHPRNDRYCVWAQKIMQHAYAGDQSLMKIGVTPLKELRFRDVMRADLSNTAMPSFVSGESESSKRIYQMVDAQAISRSGFNNAMGGGYGHRLVVQKAETVFQQTRDEIPFKRWSPYLEVSRDIRGQVTGAAGSPGVQVVEFSAIDCGNTHAKYWEAGYQNRRQSRLFSVGASIMTQQRTGVNILEPVRYLPINTPAAVGLSTKEEVRGVYMVTAKSIRLEMGNYVERFELFTQGSNYDPSKTNSQE